MRFPEAAEELEVEIVRLLLGFAAGAGEIE
jgi:hypothetical protein